MIQMFFASSILHVNLMQWQDENVVHAAVNRCDQVWESIELESVSAELCFYYIYLLLFSCVLV